MGKTNFKSLSEVREEYKGFRKTCYDKSMRFDIDDQIITIDRIIPEAKRTYKIKYQLYIDADGNYESKLI